MGARWPAPLLTWRAAACSCAVRTARRSSPVKRRARSRATLWTASSPALAFSRATDRSSSQDRSPVPTMAMASARSSGARSRAVDGEADCWPAELALERRPMRRLAFSNASGAAAAGGPPRARGGDALRLGGVPRLPPSSRSAAEGGCLGEGGRGVSASLGDLGPHPKSDRRSTPFARHVRSRRGFRRRPRQAPGRPRCAWRAHSRLKRSCWSWRVMSAPSIVVARAQQRCLQWLAMRLQRFLRGQRLTPSSHDCSTPSPVARGCLRRPVLLAANPVERQSTQWPESNDLTQVAWQERLSVYTTQCCPGAASLAG